MSSEAHCGGENGDSCEHSSGGQAVEGAVGQLSEVFEPPSFGTLTSWVVDVAHHSVPLLVAIVIGSTDLLR